VAPAPLTQPGAWPKTIKIPTSWKYAPARRSPAHTHRSANVELLGDGPDVAAVLVTANSALTGAGGPGGRVYIHGALDSLHQMLTDGLPDRGEPR
jgi:hypothetical protein